MSDAPFDVDEKEVVKLANSLSTQLRGFSVGTAVCALVALLRQAHDVYLSADPELNLTEEQSIEGYCKTISQLLKDTQLIVTDKAEDKTLN